MAETRKQIAFDLDTKALEIYYPNEHWRSAYDIIKSHDDAKRQLMEYPSGK